jgi:hypothetical protein
VRILGGDHGSAQPEARVACRHHEIHREHVNQRAQVDQPLRERDRGENQRGADERGDLGGDQGRNPGTRVDLARVDRQQVNDQDRDARMDRELAHVEHELHRRQAPVEQQHQTAAQQAPEHERIGAAEDHAEHERDVSK